MPNGSFQCSARAESRGVCSNLPRAAHRRCSGSCVRRGRRRPSSFTPTTMGSRSIREARITCTVGGTWRLCTGRIRRYRPLSPSSALVSSFGPNSFPNLTADVEFWRAHPGQNYGWILISESEETPYTARRFGSRENPANSPTLELEYIPHPRIEHSELVGNQFHFSFLAQAGQSYAVQSCDSLVGANWATLTNVPPLAFIQTVSVTAPVTVPQSFFRVRLE